MAVRRIIFTHSITSYFVLWVITTITHTGVETSRLNGEIKPPVERSPPSENLSPITAFERYKRSNEEKGMHSAKEIIDLNSTVDHENTSFSEFPSINKGITSLKEGYYDKKNPKLSKFKPFGLDKDISKSGFDAKYPPPAVTDDDKQKGVVLKTDKQIKKEHKLNVTVDEHLRNNSTNITVPYKISLNDTNNGSEIVVKNITSTSEMTETGVNVHNDTSPWEMNDQPIEQTDDVTLNNTLPADDCIDPSVINCTELVASNSTQPDGRSMPESNSTNVLLISGVCLSSLVLLGSAAGGGYVVYRRRLWNKPQTLSDKCSNADSSGYIDDSTLRENSEEMYSLDNDSFLNSLEAMTIQNYWTDNVKHTKL